VRYSIIHAASENEDRDAAAGFLLRIANRDADREARRRAIHQLGETDRESVVEELMKIYDAPATDASLRVAVLHALSEMQNTRAEDKLFEIARRTNDRQLRAQAIHRIGERAGRRSLEMLRETVGSASGETELQVQAVRAISERPAEESVPLLIKIARTHADAQVRRYAIKQLGESGDPRAIDFFKELLGK
jgi:HEAT repeat protein